MEIERLDVVDSTNLHARRLVERGVWDGRARVVVARRQTGGMGRMGRRWESPEGGLWMTALVAVDARPDPLLGLRVGVAVWRAVAEVVRPRAGRLGGAGRVELKWPNDVLVGGRKAAGVLVETVGLSGGAGRAVIAGVGVNVNNASGALGMGADAGLRRAAVSLCEVVGGRVDVGGLLVAVADGVVRAASERADAGALAEARGALYGVGRRVRVNDAGRVAEGVLAGLTDAGVPEVMCGPTGGGAAGGRFALPPGAELVFADDEEAAR